MAHYNLMLCYRGSGKADLAERERVLYERFKADEASQTITGPYRLRSPNDNNERQADPCALIGCGVQKRTAIA